MASGIGARKWQNKPEPTLPQVAPSQGQDMAATHWPLEKLYYQNTISWMTARAWASIELTHWGQDKMAAILHTIFSNALSWMKMFEFRYKFHWSLFLKVQLTIFHHWFRLWLGVGQATSHYLNQWWLDCWRIYASHGLNELRRAFHDFTGDNPSLQHIRMA